MKRLLLILGVALPSLANAAAPESAADLHFRPGKVALYADKGGKPGKLRDRLSPDELDLSTAQLLDYEKGTRMFRVQFGKQEPVWLPKSAFEPLSCQVALAPNPYVAPKGVNGDTKTLGTRGLGLKDNLCR